MYNIGDQVKSKEDGEAGVVTAEDYESGGVIVLWSNDTMSWAHVADLEPLDTTATPAARPMQPPMSLRDWFAGQALVGMLSDPDWDPQSNRVEDAARYAYSMADAMLAARDFEGV